MRGTASFHADPQRTSAHKDGQQQGYSRENWRDKSDISTFYFTRFTEDITEKELWYHFKRWGDVKQEREEIWICKIQRSGGCARFSKENGPDGHWRSETVRERTQVWERHEEDGTGTTQNAVALTWTIWKHRNGVVFANQTFEGSKVMEDAIFLLWTWLKLLEKGFTLHFNHWSSHLTAALCN